MKTNLFNILRFSCQGKGRDIVYQCILCWLSWKVFVEHGLTVYSALSRLIYHGIYYMARCGIWLLTIYHIPYINFQLELRKVTPPNLHLSFVVQYITLCECYALFNLYMIHQAPRKGKGTKIQIKNMSPAGFEPATSTQKAKPASYTTRARRLKFWISFKRAGMYVRGISKNKVWNSRK